MKRRDVAKWRQPLAVALTIALIGNGFGVPAQAGSVEKGPWPIDEVADLPEEVKNRQVGLGTEEGELGFPEFLQVVTGLQEEEDENPVASGSRWERMATASDSKGSFWEQVPVTWSLVDADNGLAAYDGEVPGTYTFEAELADSRYEMGDALLPMVTVEVDPDADVVEYIGEQIGLLEAAGEADRYLFGFEESYGYLSGAHVRDKDGVNAVMLACECAAWYRGQQMTLLDALHALYQKFGFYQNSLLSWAFEGQDGMREMKSLMDSLRTAPPAEIAGQKVLHLVDYQNDPTGLIPSDVLEFRLSGDTKLIVRPSGTEPKLKLYLSVRGESEAESLAALDALTAGAAALVGKQG